MTRILVLDAHPGRDRFCSALADSYEAAAREARAEVVRVNLRDLDFDPILHEGYEVIQPLEPDLQAAFEKIRWANHIAVFYPMWWGSHPALLQGFFERTFLPGTAFKDHKDGPGWDKLLSGRSAEVVTTMDVPRWFNRFVYRNPGSNQIKRAIFGFTGVKARVRVVGGLKNKTAAQRKGLIQWAGWLGGRAARRGGL